MYPLTPECLRSYSRAAGSRPSDGSLSTNQVCPIDVGDPLTVSGITTAPTGERLYYLRDLNSKLDEFESYLTSEELTSSARFSYVDGSGRFLRWLSGEYRPRNAGATPKDRGAKRSTWTVAQLREDVHAYADELRAAGLKPLAQRAYVGRADTFVRWLDGRYTSRGPRGDTGQVEEDDSWLAEAAVQARLIAWLERGGWTIARQAQGREHGTDIDAVRGEERLSVEVKGHPQQLHTFGVNKGQPRKWHPAAQARTYFGNALHTAMTMLHADPERQVAIALPDVAVYRGLVDRSRDPIRQLGILIWFVGRDGEVIDG